MELDHRSCGRIPNSESADLGGRGHVPVHEHRRHRQDPRDVVEPEGPRVGRQHARPIDFQPEQILDRIDVFGAIQPPDGDAPGIGMRRPKVIQRGDERRHEGVKDRLVGSWPTHRRHLPVA